MRVCVCVCVRARVGVHTTRKNVETYMGGTGTSNDSSAIGVRFAT